MTKASKVLAVGVLALVVIAAGVLYALFGGTTMQAAGGGATNNFFGDKTSTPSGIDDNIGQFRPAIYNPLNTSGTEYLADTIRVYRIENGKEVFYGTVATATTGIPARDGTVLKHEIYDLSGQFTGVVGSPLKYVAYVPTSDASHTSARIEFTGAEDIAKEYPIPQQAALQFKVYDEENRGYLYESADAAAGTLTLTGGTFYSTTSNSSGYAVGQGDFYDYTIYLSTNGTAATDTQGEDQVVYVGVDASDLSDWEEPSLSMSGVSITKLSSGQYNDKIKNLGYDWVYKLESSGKPIHIGSSFNKLRIQQYAKSSVDPSDDVIVGVFTGGYFKQTTGSNMLLDTHKDDSSQTGAYTAQSLTLSLA